MALAEVTASFLRRVSTPLNTRRLASTTSTASTASTTTSSDPDLDSTGFDDQTVAKDYDPTARSRAFKKQLPANDFAFRSPRYYRGPLHPVQPLKASHPYSREFRAGPFSLPRLQQTYDDTVAQDLMTLSYQHFPPGYRAPPKANPYRRWVGDSPYYKNRPARGPRGGRLLFDKEPMTFNNIPRFKKVVVHSMANKAISNIGYLTVAEMAIQAITNVRPYSGTVKRSDASWGLVKGQHVSCTSELVGEDMYHFLSKLVDVVMPKIKDYKGVKGSSGDSTGNLAFGFTPEQVALFPEIEVNLDAYPVKMMPGCHVIVQTTARTDRDARMLMASIGIPFYGKFVD